MIGKFLSFVIGLALIAGLTACGSLAAKASGAGPNNIQGDEKSGTNAITPAPNGNDVLTLDNGVKMRVLWTIHGYVMGPASTMDENGAKAFLFKPLDMNDTEITFDGQTCQNVNFQQETANAADYLSSTWQTSPQALGIDDQELQVFKTNCSLPGFQEYVRLADGRLIVLINGVFFFFEPAVAH